MSLLLPTPLVLVGGVAALLLLPSLVHWPGSTPRLAVEAFGATLGLMTLFRLGWVVVRQATLVSSNHA